MADEAPLLVKYKKLAFPSLPPRMENFLFQMGPFNESVKQHNGTDNDGLHCPITNKGLEKKPFTGRKINKTSSTG